MRPADTLTRRELEAVWGVCTGQKNREIAECMGTTENMVKRYLQSVFDKVGVWSRLELALYVEAHKEEFYASEAHMPEIAAIKVAEATR